jgi:hypothetical protein
MPLDGQSAVERSARGWTRNWRRLMEILPTLTYVALCYATFKLFRIPVN